MTVQELEIGGVLLVAGTRFPDQRGDFRRLVPFTLLAEAGFEVDTAYVASATNLKSGTVRGLHYQESPNAETKALWCHAGSLFDVLVDIRPDSVTHGHWISVDLSATRPEVVIVPEGVAHGYQTTSSDTGVTYLIGGNYVPESARTINWQDETLGITWPLSDATVSPADAAAPGWLLQP